MAISNLSQIDIVILCGGLGTRLRPLISDRPKVLAPFKNKTFLDLLLEDLITQGAKRFIFCVGYLNQMLQDHITHHYQHIENIFSVEDQPLGTGGAIKKAISHIQSKPFLILNGDSICRINYNDLLNFHIEKRANFTMALSNPKDRNDGGNVLINNKQKIIKYSEKISLEEKGFINAGIYLMENTIYSLMPIKDVFSLEFDLFPKLVNQKSFGFLTESDVIDIGTVERYQNAINIL